MGFVVRLFGKMEVCNRDCASPLILDSQGKALLGYLILQRRSVTRDQLIEALWRAQSSRTVQHRLNTALWRLRRSLANHPQIVLHTKQICSVAIEPAAEGAVDVLDFERLTRVVLRRPSGAPAVLEQADITDLEQALSLYRGELLDEFYDEWVLAERRRYHDLYLACLTTLSRHYRCAGLYQRAAQLCEARLESDPLCEEAHLGLIEIYWAEGQRSSALRQYRLCCELLKNELGVQPNAPMRHFVQRIVRNVDPPLPTLGSSESSSVMAEYHAMRIALEQLGHGLKEMSEAYARLAGMVNPSMSELTAAPLHRSLFDSNIKP
jgi:DNA-binding SARP family transcriptional activator